MDFLTARPIRHRLLGVASLAMLVLSGCARTELTDEQVTNDLVDWQIALDDSAGLWTIAPGTIEILSLVERTDTNPGRSFDATFRGRQELVRSSAGLASSSGEPVDPADSAQFELSGVLRLGYSQEGGVWRLRAVENFGIERKPIGDLAHSLATFQQIDAVGTALFAWLTDQFGGAAVAGQDTFVDLNLYPPSDLESIRAVLVPDYLDEVPERDAWGNAYRFALSEDVLAERVMSVASPGRDGVYQDGSYTVGRFAVIDFDQDVVWADGFFVRRPDELAIPVSDDLPLPTQRPTTSD